MKLKLAITVAFLVFALVACGSPTGANTTSVTPTPQPVQPTPTPTSAPQTKTPDAILQALKAAGLPIGASITYTADNDVNHLLGRPYQYIGKANWIDTRISTTDTGVNISVSDGGSIETFTNTTDANARFTYIQQISKSSPMFAEYEYLQGTYILRVSAQLTPDQAKAYEAAFMSATK